MRHNAPKADVSPFRERKLLDPFPQCWDCLVGLVETATRLASNGDERMKQRAAAAAGKALDDSKGSDLSSPEVANRILREIKAVAGVDDPYRDFKAREMSMARRVFKLARKHAGSDMRSCLSLAVLGNSMDFFTTPEDALDEIVDQVRNGVSFYHDDVHRLENALADRPGLVLYLADNSGEIYFDLPLYEYLRDHAHKVVLVVKGGPALNDATRAELRAAGLLHRFESIADTGCEGAGIEWRRVSPEFMRLVQSAQLIISKGMANLETVNPHPLSTPVFFLFKVKCDPMKKYLDAPPGSYCALWRNGS